MDTVSEEGTMLWEEEKAEWDEKKTQDEAVSEDEEKKEQEGALVVSVTVQRILDACASTGLGDLRPKPRKSEWKEFVAHADLHQSDQLCAYVLGWCSDIGQGVAKDLEEAARLFRLSTDQGGARAQFNLGFCYEWGGVGKRGTL